MTNTQSMTIDAAEAYRKGLAEGFEMAREMAAEVAASEPEPDGSPPPALANKPVWTVAVAAIRATKRNVVVRIRAMEPPA